MSRFVVLVALASAIAASQGMAQTTSSTPSRGRPALEQQLRERAARLLQDRLKLTDDQMTRLEQTNRKFAPQLTQLIAQERETRRQLRTEIQSTNPNQQHVSDLLATALQIQRRRIDVVDAEQKDLATFLTPVQRAQYLAFQVQMRRRADQLANQNRRPGPRKRPGMERVP